MKKHKYFGGTNQRIWQYFASIVGCQMILLIELKDNYDTICWIEWGGVKV